MTTLVPRSAESAVELEGEVALSLFCTPSWLVVSASLTCSLATECGVELEKYADTCEDLVALETDPEEHRPWSPRRSMLFAPTRSDRAPSIHVHRSRCTQLLAQ